jgi:hypothetical protein
MRSPGFATSAISHARRRNDVPPGPGQSFLTVSMHSLAFRVSVYLLSVCERSIVDAAATAARRKRLGVIPH